MDVKLDFIFNVIKTIFQNYDLLFFLLKRKCPRFNPNQHKYKHIHCVFKLYDILSYIWFRGTYAHHIKPNWTESNNTLG